MHVLTKAAGVLAVAAAAALSVAAVATAAPHHQSSDQCGSGIYAGYTGTQENGNDQSVVVQNSTPVASSHSRGSDDCFFWFAYDGGQNKIAEYAPDGVASNLVLSVQDRWGFGKNNRGSAEEVVLQKADGSLDQQWNYNTADNGTWTNEGTNLVLTVGRNGQLELATPPTGTVPPQEDWTFQSAP
jgi:hypothetical protein